MSSQKNLMNYLLEIKSVFRNSWRTNRIIWDEKKGLVIITIVIYAIVSLLPTVQSGINALFINHLIKIIGGLAIDPYFYWMLSLLLFFELFTPILSNLDLYFNRLMWFFLEKKFQIDIIAKLGSLDIAIHEDPKYKDLINKINEGGIYRLQSFSERQFFILQNIIGLFASSAVLIYSNWWLFVIIFLSTIPMLINELRYGRSVWNIHSSKAEVKRKYQEIYWRFGLVNSLIEMKIFQNVDYFVNTISDLYSIFQSEELRITKTKIRYQLIATLISQISYGFAFIWFVFQVVNGGMEIGTLTFMLASIGALRSSLSGFFNNLARHYEDNLFVSDVYMLYDTPPIIHKPNPGILISAKSTPVIEFKNVSFKYPHTKKYVLKNFSLAIKPGEKVALVGINGAGKTTIIKLLCRFYDPINGKILINGHDLQKINLDSWYNQIGAIFQDYEKYHFTIKETIALGRTSKKLLIHKVKNAAKASEADIFIQEWENKYEQMLGMEYSDGVEPSVGQWQKIALARTFYRDPRILILDEPTSSIDAQTEAKIFDKLHKLPRNRTVIIISHRFSTVRNADHICVLKGGQMIEYGTHQQLIDNDKIYKKLFTLQAKGYK